MTGAGAPPEVALAGVCFGVPLALFRDRAHLAVVGANRCGMIHRLFHLTETQLMGYYSIMDKKLIAKVMAELGSRTSKAKAAAARENGKKGGRPRKAKVKR
jgi:hypothetical protein